MRTSLKMQQLQPDLQAVQNRYKDNPEKQRLEMMEVYKKHGMSPLSQITGCLPMFLPMPVLFALFFVFQNTIELRGVSFLWFGDLSSHDPLYILPVLMALSMYLLSWMGMKNSPPNPQAKMMSYMFPAMFLFFMWRVAAGLNLYYATQNLAALPQQWLLTRQRAKQPVPPTTAKKPGTSAKTR
jgi:YidC/Oxa1 family membrane protein insertase